MIPRKRLLAKLGVVEPARAKTHGGMEILTRFMFTGSHLIAYDERVAIAVPQETKFTGAISHGLADMLEASRAAALELLPEGDASVEIRLGDTCVKLESLPAADFPFTMPAMPREFHKPTERFFEAIDDCMQSINEASDRSDEVGVTLIADGSKNIKLFSTDRTSITYCKVEMDKTVPKGRLILSPAFCRQMLRLADRAYVVRLAIGEGCALFTADDTMLFGPLLRAEESPWPFERTMQGLLPDGWEVALIPIPRPKLRLALERAAHICEIKGAEKHSKIEIKDGVATLHSQSMRGEVVDKVALPGHPDVELEVHAHRLLGCLASFDDVLFGKKAAVMANGDRVYLVAAR